MSITFYPASKDQATNRRNLAEGVQGVKCANAGTIDSVHEDLSSSQWVALNQIRTEKGRDRVISIIEVYVDGSLNVYVRDIETNTMVGFYAVRTS